MKLWLLKRDDKATPTWDATFGFVVRADEESEARELAATDPGDEGKGPWLDPAATACVCIGEGDGEPGIILRDFNAG